MNEIELFRGANSFAVELNIDEETGEILSALPLDVLVQRNPVGTVAFVLNSEAQAGMLKAHIKAVTTKLKSIESRAERAKTALKEVMQATGVLSVKSADGTFKAVLHKERDESVDVFDEKQLPQDYLREIPVSYAPDKKLIKKAIDDGFDVPGAKIVKNDRLVIG